MFRNIYTRGIVLKKYRVGEFHKGINFLTRDYGTIHAIAHGAYKIKNRFRGLTELFTLSKLFLYRNPVNNSFKVVDIVPVNTFDGIRKNVPKFFTACLWAEIIIKSYGGGEESPVLFNLFAESLQWLDRAEETSSVFISFQFLWRFLRILGCQPQLDSCSYCSRSIRESESLFFSDYGTALLCDKCRNQGIYTLLPGMKKYLIESSALPLARAIKIRLEFESTSMLKKVLYHLVETQLEVRLNSIQSGAGII